MMTTPQPLVFFGSGAFGVPTLEALCAAHDLRAAVTQPDRPAGRGGTLTPTPVAQWIAANRPEVPVIKPERVNDADVVSKIRAFGARVFIVIAFGQKIGAPILDGVSAMNLHASLLPRWRGAAPINAAVLAGDTETGNSVITLADRMDAGFVLGKSTRQIEQSQTAGELHDLLSQDGPQLVLRVIDEVCAGRSKGETQDERLVTKAAKLGREDGWVDFNDNAEICRRRVHGLTPWPGVTVKFRGENLKLLRVRSDLREVGMPHAGGAQPGTLLSGKADIGIVACGGDTCLQILEVQPAGKRAMAWRDFANGRGVKSEEGFVGGRAAC